jgi:hypothetical protein
MRKALRRLRLRDGDVIVVRNREDAEALMTARVKGVPNCPIIIAQESIHRLSKEYLRKLCAQTVGE